MMVKTAKTTNTKGKDVGAHYVEFETPTGNYTLYLDWSFGDKLIVTVWDDEMNDETIFDEEIEL